MNGICNCNTGLDSRLLPLVCPVPRSKDAEVFGEAVVVGGDEDRAPFRSCCRVIWEIEERKEARDKLGLESMRLPRCEARLSWLWWDDCCSCSEPASVSVKAAMAMDVRLLLSWCPAERGGRCEKCEV